jgi:glucosamine-6-phosphate deaminase
MRISEENLSIYLGSSRSAMGLKAAQDVAADLRRRLAKQDGVRMMFAAGPSQSEMLAALVEQPGIDWRRVTAFHMDEYIDLPPDAPQRFGFWLREQIFDKVPFGKVHLIETDGDINAAAANYAAKLAEGPIDIVCLGIGVNGHLAFNDPPADFDDPEPVRLVQMDAICRQQQVDDGCFLSIDAVPKRALTVTIPPLMAADRLFCCVPGPRKREAVRRTLHDAIGPEWPATALRLHPNCTIYLDSDSAPDGVGDR